MTSPISIQFLAALFLAPAFAGAGALLVGIPILIHILNRRRYKLVNWAAMDFLLKALRKNRRRLRFEQLVLLITRCLVLLLLGLALARPTGCNDSTLAGLAGERNSLHVLVIDNSYSLAYEASRPDARTHLDQARKLARQIVAGLSAGGESVAIITAARPATAVILKPTFDLQSAVAAIDRIEQSFGSTDLLGALTLARQIAQAEPRPVPRYLDLFTDSTRSAWIIPQADALAKTGTELAGLFHVQHFSLGQTGQSNAAVLNLHPSSRLVTTRFPTELLATVRAFGPSSPITVQWKQDETLLPTPPAAQFDATSAPIVQPRVVFPAGGGHTLSATVLSTDRLPIDNTHYRAVDVASELRLLIVEGERGSGALSSSAAFLQLALAPPQEGTGKSDSNLLPELISDIELAGKPLDSYRSIVLCGVGQVSPAVADQLQRFVQAGGTLVVTMGEAVNADNYNHVLTPRKLLPGMLVRRMASAADSRGYTFDFNPRGLLHPLLNIFRNEEKSGLDTVQVFTYWQVQLPTDSPAERVLNFVSDAPDKPADPAITVHSFGEGRVVFFATTVNADWTSLPAKLAFVPLMQELVGGTIAGNDAWMNRLVGQSIELPATIKLTTVPSLTDISQRQWPMHAQTINGATVYQSDPIPRPGIYMLQTGLKKIPIAVNVPDDEADIRVLDGPAIKRALGQIEMESFGDQLSAQGPGAEGQSHHDFGWIIMLAVLALAGIESFMAMRFGHPVKRK